MTGAWPGAWPGAWSKEGVCSLLVVTGASLVVTGALLVVTEWFSFDKSSHQ